MKIKLVSIGLVNTESKTLSNYLEKVTSIIQQQSDNEITIFVLPEYCWGNINLEEYTRGVETIERMLQEDQYVVYGSFPIMEGNHKFNIAYFGGKLGILHKVAKTRILSDEAGRNQVVSGSNITVIEIGTIRVAIIICADIWDNSLLNKLILDENADILLVPSFTVVPKFHDSYARIQWYSLAIVRSREYLVPIAIADHKPKEDMDITAGGATCIVDPSLKNEEMKQQTDFLELPKDDVASLVIDLEEVRAYRDYRLEKGLFQKKSSNDS